MNHHKSKRKLSRTKNQRNSLLKTLATSLITVGKIKTTEAKARELRPFIEKLVTLAKTGTIHSRRTIVSRIGDNNASEKLFLKTGLDYKDRKGGYTRIVKLPKRLKDASKMAFIEFVK